MARPTRRRDPFRDGQTTAVTVVEQGAVELSYDYSRLPEEERAAVQRAARVIKPLLRRTAEDIFVIGGELAHVKAGRTGLYGVAGRRVRLVGAHGAALRECALSG